MLRGTAFKIKDVWTFFQMSHVDIWEADMHLGMVVEENNSIRNSDVHQILKICSPQFLVYQNSLMKSQLHQITCFGENKP